MDALVDRAAADAPHLAGVQSSAATAARFAGRWSEIAAAGAEPVEAQRLYRLDGLVQPPAVPGRARWATVDELDVVAAWAEAFAAETDLPPAPLARLSQRIEQQRVWVWDDGRPSAMAMVVPAAARATRVGLVYTPPERRGRGLAAAVVAACSAWALAEEADVCLLFTQLQNATSNGVYRRLGYRAVDEVLRYRLSPPAAR